MTEIVKDMTAALKAAEDEVFRGYRLVAELRERFPDHPLVREAADHIEQLEEWKQLYRGDVMSLNIELDGIHEDMEDKDKYIDQLEKALESIGAIVNEAVPWVAKSVKGGPH